MRPEKQNDIVRVETLDGYICRLCVFDLLEGSMTRFDTVFECAEYFGVDPVKVHDLATAGSPDVFLGRYLVAYMEDEIESGLFLRISDKDRRQWIRHNYPRAVYVTDGIGGYVFRTIKEAARSLGIREGVLWKKLEGRTMQEEKETQGLDITYLDALEA